MKTRMGCMRHVPVPVARAHELVVVSRVKLGLLLLFLLAVTGVMVAAPGALAGSYTVLTCPGDAGWSQDTPNAQFIIYDDACVGSGTGGLTLALGPNPDGNYLTNSDGAITFAVPSGFSIQSYAMRVTAYGGPCAIVNSQCASGFGNVWVNHTGQADPDYDYRNLGYASQSVEVAPSGPLNGVSWVTVGVGCDGGPGGYECPGSQAGSAEALAEVHSADFVIASATSPTGAGFAGSLLEPGAHGTAELQFTAGDPAGPGVYSVTVQIDGATVYQATPDGNGGHCVAQGTSSSGALMFDYQQPCKQTETIDIPVDTTRLADGEHALKVIVTDAAQNTSVVYTRTITTSNRTTVSALLDSPLLSPPGFEPTYALVLDKHTAALGNHVARSFPDSALTLSGEVRDTAGVPAPGVTVSLLAQDGSSPAGAPSVVARTLSDAAGQWVLHAPKGPSRLLRIVYGNTAAAASAATGIGLTETVTPLLGLKVRTPGGARIVFSGQLAIAPLGSPRPLVTIETRAGHEWEAVGHAVRVNANGTYSYTYTSSPLTLGRSFAFRAQTPATALWRAAYSPTRKAVVH